MLFKKKKKKSFTLEFRKACLVINSCETYEHLKSAMNYIHLYYKMTKDFKEYNHLQKLLSKKMDQVFPKTKNPPVGGLDVLVD